IISGITYVFLSLQKLRRHRKNIANQFSNTDKINLMWLRYLIIGMTCIWVAVIFGNDTYVYTIAVLYVFFIGYFGIKQTTIFSPNRPLLPENIADEETEDELPKIDSFPEPKQDSNERKEKYQKSGLNENELRFIFNRLTDLMEQEKLFINPELTLGDAAQQLNIHPNHLSQVINSIANKNFYDYINSQRVEEFIRIVQLPKNQKFTLLSLAFECGFNSKTSFNRNFRKVTGLSPSEYLKQIHVNLSQAS
ncbi:MAG: helix-turn-helix domain-containing protein, partial [Flavobacterium sp.]